MKGLKEQIEAILHDFSHFKGEESTYIHLNDRENIVNQILFLPIPNLWVEKKCPECLGKPADGPRCIICNHTGIIRRPATWADVDMKNIIQPLTMINLEDKGIWGQDSIQLVLSIILLSLTTPDGSKLVWEDR